MNPDPNVYNREERRLIDIANKLAKEARRIEFQVNSMYHKRKWEEGAPERARLAQEERWRNPSLLSLTPREFMNYQEGKITG